MSLTTTEMVLIAVYVLMAVYPIALFFVLMPKRLRIPYADTILQLICILTLACAIHISVYFMPNQEAKDLASDLLFSLQSSAAVLFFFYALYFFNRESYVNRPVMLAMFSIPACTLAWVTTNPILGLFRKTGSVGNAPFTPLFFLNWYFTFALIAVSVILVFFQHFKLPAVYREPSRNLLISALLVFAGVFFSLTDIPVDIFLILFIVSLRFFYLSTRSSKNLDFLRNARKEIYDHLDEAVFILDEQMTLVDTNQQSAALIDSLGIERGRDLPFAPILDALTKKATHTQTLDEDGSGIDFYFDRRGKTKTFNLREKIIYDKRKKSIGTFAIYTDVTENRALLQRLEVSAGRDALTGLANRNMIEFFKKDLDRPENLPFSVIVCDLNNLKSTNDIHGHQAGDLMLRVAGGALSACCPPSAQVGRIGGDEFLILMPQTFLEKAIEVIGLINKHLAAAEVPFEVTIAMGAAQKTQPSEKLADVINVADAAMYENKKAIKAARGLLHTLR